MQLCCVVIMWELFTDILFFYYEISLALDALILIRLSILRICYQTGHILRLLLPACNLDQIRNPWWNFFKADVWCFTLTASDWSKFPNDYNYKQAQESLAAAMSLNSIVTSWANDCTETTDSKLLQPSTGNKQNVTCNLYPLTFAFKGKL